MLVNLQKFSMTKTIITKIDLFQVILNNFKAKESIYLNPNAIGKKIIFMEQSIEFQRNEES